MPPPPLSELTGASIATLFTDTRFRYTRETALHDAIEMLLLHQGGIPDELVKREVKLSPKDRIDFLIAGHIGIEVKIKGTAANVWAQLARYAGHEQITELVLLTSVPGHAVRAPRELNGKPVRIIAIRGGL